MTSLPQHDITIVQQPARHIKRFNAQEVPFLVTCRPDLAHIRDISDYLGVIDGILDNILERLAGFGAGPDDMIGIMLVSLSCTNPIRTAWVRKRLFSKELVYEAIEKVYQSITKFILDGEFKVYGRIVKEPRIGGGGRDHTVQNAAEARLYKKFVNYLNVGQHVLFST